MQIDLAELQPQLIAKKKKAQEEFRVLTINKKEAAKVEKVTSKEAAICGEQEKAALELAAYCQGELDKVLPILAEAKRALSKLTSNDITLVKS